MIVTLDTKTIVNYSDLMKTIQSLLYNAWGKNKIILTSAYPKINQADLKTPIITYMCTKRPGRNGKDVEIKSRERGSISVLNDEGETISVSVLGQIFDYDITFEIWGGDGTEADQISENFENFIATYTQYLVKLGVRTVLFTERDDSQSQHQWRSDLIKRSITYKFVIDQVTNLEYNMLQSIEITAAPYKNTFELLVAEFNNNSSENEDVINTILNKNKEE